MPFRIDEDSDETVTFPLSWSTFSGEGVGVVVVVVVAADVTRWFLQLRRLPFELLVVTTELTTRTGDRLLRRTAKRCLVPESSRRFAVFTVNRTTVVVVVVAGS